MIEAMGTTMEAGAANTRSRVALRLGEKGY